MSSKNLKLKYISFYNDRKFNKGENRNTHLAATNKINYICSALVKSGYDVDIISLCWSENESGYYKGNVYNISDEITLRNFATFGSKNNLTRKTKQLFAAFQLLLFLIFNTKKNEQILVYHSLALMLPIRLASTFKNLKLVLEVEEVYTDVWDTNSTKKKELKYINKAQKYILVSDILKEMFNQKPSVVLYGSYHILETDAVEMDSRATIDIVYAGSIDTIKGGAKNAVLCMDYLSGDYRMHILGFGEKSAIDRLLQDIALVNKNKKFECCKYHGTMVDDDYKNFLLNCDIGVNPQYQGEYMNTAFPSKILSYLTHNLKVVSTEIKSIKISKVASFINFAENDNPKSIAKAIVVASNGKLAQNNIIRNLDTAFVRDLKSLMDK